MLEHERRQLCLRTAAIGFADDGGERLSTDPVARAFVAEHVTPAAGARGKPVLVDAVGNRSGSGNQHDARFIADACDQRHERVVDDQRVRRGSQAPHDAAHDAVVLGAIDAGHAEAHSGRENGAVADGLLDDRMQDLFDFELAVRLQVRAAAAPFADDAPFASAR